MYAVVPAGGSGTRLWPLSRAGRPKFLHPLTPDGRTLIRATLDRLAALAGTGETYVVTGGAHAAGIARELPDLPAANLLVEPAPRDSAPAIGLAAALIAARDPAAVMGSFASDHLVADDQAFHQAVRTAARLAEQGLLVTVGITPTGPETGYGYIRRGRPLDLDGGFAVSEFTEKPLREVAERYLATGEYSWNASMFVWRVDVFLAELRRQQPDLAAGLARIAADWDTPRREETLGVVWPSLPKVTVDVGVLEDAARHGLVGVVPADFGWTDVGDWDALGGILSTSDGAAVLGDAAAVLAVDSGGTVSVPAAGRLVALLGARDLVVVDTPDALLVCARDRAQEVRRIVERLRAAGRTDLL